MEQALQTGGVIAVALILAKIVEKLVNKKSNGNQIEKFDKIIEILQRVAIIQEQHTKDLDEIRKRPCQLNK